jgi:Skp family chaperone for outer membrane proteins
LSDQENRMRRRIIDKVETLVRDTAEAEGYTLVLDGSSRGVSGTSTVLLYDQAMDITESVLKSLKKDADNDDG